MSLARMACRLQAIEALNSDPAIAALVKGRVFDSRISALDHREPVPVILVTTEETKGEAWSKQNGGAPFDLSCDLVLEIAMNALGGTDAEPMVGYVTTDRELEAMLDLLEERAIDVITVGETDAARLLRSAVTRRVPHVASSRFATDQTGEKLAVRLLTLRVELKGEDQRDVTQAAAGPYAVLPEPLRSVALASAAGGSVRETCDLIAASIPAVVETPFLGADIVVAPNNLAASTPPSKAYDIGAGRFVDTRATIPDWSQP